MENNLNNSGRQNSDIKRKLVEMERNGPLLNQELERLTQIIRDSQSKTINL